MSRLAYDLTAKRVWVAGHAGMVGSALVKRLQSEDCVIITAPRSTLDLRQPQAVDRFLQETRPHVVLLAAAKVGGILANDTYPADFLFDNLMIEANVIHGAFRAGVEKLTFLGSSCIYPKHANQPISESELLTGPLEPTNEWYAIAKIAGIKLCQAYRLQHGCDFISVMPTNLYGPNDNFDLKTSHVLPALLAKAHHAKIAHQTTFEIWGTGHPLREFMHVDDCADAIVFLTKHYSDHEHVNIGSGQEVSIRELAETVMATVGLNATLIFDRSKPDGTPRKRLNTRRLESLGWHPSIPLKDGIATTYKWYCKNVPTAAEMLH